MKNVKASAYYTDIQAFHVGVEFTGTMPYGCQSTGTASVVIPDGCESGPYSYEWSYSDNGIDYFVIPNSNMATINTEVLAYSTTNGTFNTRYYIAKVANSIGIIGFGTGISVYSCSSWPHPGFRPAPNSASKAKSISLSIAPNPIKDQTLKTICNLEETGIVRMHVYSIEGKLIKTLFEGNLEKGEHSFDFKTKFSAGQYLLLMEAGKESLNQKFIVQ